MSHHIWLFEWKSMKVFELLCLSIATIWMKLNVIISIHHWMKSNVMYIHWVKLIFWISSNFGFSKIFRINEPIVSSEILKKPSLFSQNNEQITFPSFIKAYLIIFRFYEFCTSLIVNFFHFINTLDIPIRWQGKYWTFYLNLFT
jgi:hypothetical protein